MSSPTQRSGSQQRQEQVRLSLGEEAEVAQQLRLGTDRNHLVHTFKLLRLTVFNIKKMPKISSNAPTPQRFHLSLRPRAFSSSPRLNTSSMILRFFCQGQNMPFTCGVFQERALLLQVSAMEKPKVKKSARKNYRSLLLQVAGLRVVFKSVMMCGACALANTLIVSMMQLLLTTGLRLEKVWKTSTYHVISI